MINYPFWVNDFDRVKDHRITHPEVAKIFQQPVAFWYGAKKNKNATKKLNLKLEILKKYAILLIISMLLLLLLESEISKISIKDSQKSEGY